MKYTFNRELESLKLQVMQMAVLVRQAVSDSYQAMVKRDGDLARAVILGDENMDNLELQIDDACLKMLALDQPVAHDLRFVIGSMQVADFLESIADQAEKLAQRSLGLPDKPLLPYDPLMEKLYIHVFEMLEQVISAYNHENEELARKVCEAEAEANSINNRILHEASLVMLNDPSQVEMQVQKIIMARYLERIADLAENAAMSVVLIKKGQNIKHIFKKKVNQQSAENKIGQE